MSRSMAKSMFMDHPFVFVIRDNTTNMNLFIGAVENP
jgi:serine protease inhibitor